jgi:pimeloyl-ACP methyl ester carboxylesterase
MCDQRVWSPVRARLPARIQASYVPTETQTERAGMLALLDALDAPLDLVGFSMGGYLALAYTLARPERVRSLAVVCASAYGLSPTELDERRRAIAWLETHVYRGIAASRLNQFIHPSRRDDPAVAGVVRDMDRDLGQAVLLAQLRETSERQPLTARLPEIACPVLIVGADADPFAPRWALEDMARHIPGARYVEAAGSGHMLPLEQPDWLADELVRFCDAVAAGASRR